MDKPLILVVDDEQALTRAFKRTLTTRGYNVEVADSCDDALKILETKSIDLVIADLALPDKSGIDLMRIMRASDLWKDIPVIIQSGFSSKMQNEVLALLPHQIFQKPTPIDDIILSIQGALPNFTA